MSVEDGWHDEACGACAVLEVELRLPVVPLPDESDKSVHQAWLALATVPDWLRRDYMVSHGIDESWWLAWLVVEKLTWEVEREKK